MNRKSKITTQKLTRLALLAASAVVLGYIEGFITAFMPLPPGVKLGLQALSSGTSLLPDISVAYMPVRIIHQNHHQSYRELPLHNTHRVSLTGNRLHKHLHS